MNRKSKKKMNLFVNLRGDIAQYYLMNVGTAQYV